MDDFCQVAIVPQGVQFIRISNYLNEVIAPADNVQITREQFDILRFVLKMYFRLDVVFVGCK